MERKKGQLNIVAAWQPGTKEGGVKNIKKQCFPMSLFFPPSLTPVSLPSPSFSDSLLYKPTDGGGVADPG